MLSYVERMGRKQWLNLLNPFHFGFREFRLTPDFAFNGAVRHHLTSFGDDLQLDAYLNIAGRRSVITAHAYGSSELTLPGLEGQFFFGPRALGALRLEPQARIMAWIQPQEQRFFANRGQAGGLVSGRIAVSNVSSAQPYLELEAKTPGWVAGNPYLGSKLALRVGMEAQF
jgi:hypothetical protein